MKRGWGKRADEDPSHHLYILLFEAVMVTCVMIALFLYVRSFENSKALEKSYLAKDLALMTFAVTQSPGFVNYVYASNQIFVQQYNFEFQKGQVLVTDNIGGRKGTPFFYPYFDKKNLLLETLSLNNPFGLLFQFDQNNLKISGANAFESLKCPDVDTKDDNAKLRKIAIDPAHGVDTRIGSDTNSQGAGYVVGSLKEQDLTRDISASLESALKQKGYNSILTRQGDAFVPPVDRASIVSRDDVISVVSIHTGMDDNTYDSVKAYIYSSSHSIVKSEKLACLILNEFAKKYPQVYTPDVIRVDDVSTNDLKILDTDKVAVLVEVGNINYENTILKSQSPELAEPIANALVKYYG